VGDVARYINGRAFKPEDWESEGRPIIRIQNLSRDGAPFNYTTKDVEERYIVEPGSLLASWSATLDVYVWSGPQAVLNQHIFKVEPDLRLVTDRYIRWALTNALAEMRASEATHGTTMRHINRGPFVAHPFPLPPLAEQHRIVEAIEEYTSRLDAGVASLRRARRNLARMRASVLAAAVEGRLVEPEGEWATVTMGEVVADSLLGLVRSRAEQRATPPGVPYLKMDGIRTDGRILWDGMTYVSAGPGEVERFALRDGDILFNTRNSAELVGKTGLVIHPPQGTVFNNNIMRLRTVPAAMPAYLNAVMNSTQFKDQMRAYKSATTSVAAVYAKDLMRLPVPLPSLPEQQRIVQEVDRQFSILDAMEAAIDTGLARADRLRQSILRDAFAGRLVPQDPADEPASALLDRIAAGRTAR